MCPKSVRLQAKGKNSNSESSSRDVQRVDPDEAENAELFKKMMKEVQPSDSEEDEVIILPQDKQGMISKNIQGVRFFPSFFQIGER
jgi:hypothetical protein